MPRTRAYRTVVTSLIVIGLAVLFFGGPAIKGWIRATFGVIALTALGIDAFVQLAELRSERKNNR